MSAVVEQLSLTLEESSRRRLFSVADMDRLRRDYSRYADEGRVSELAAEMNRTRQHLSRWAKKLGISKVGRPRPYISEPSSRRAKEWLKSNPHPRGMLGKKQSEQFKDAQSQRAFDRWHALGKEGQITFGQNAKRSWKAGWRVVGGSRIYFRSRWEANYGRYLEWLRQQGEISKWEHEPKCFWFLEIKRGTRSYLPDFRVTENGGSSAYHEVKGWMDAASKTKIRRMAKYYPKEKLIVIVAKDYKAIEKMVGRMISGWEF